MEQKNSRLQLNKFFIPLVIFEIVVAICCYQGVVRSYNATMFALSYKYGFTSRSLLGTIYQGLNDIMPFDMMNYDSVFVFANVITVIFFVIVMAFTYYILTHIDADKRHTCLYLLFFFDTFVVSTFFAGFNFMRVDLFMIIIAIASVFLICKGRLEWLIIPLSMLSVMFHQGFVFMYFNVALVLLIYQACTTKNYKKYVTIAALSFIAVSVLFVWFEFFSRSNGMSIYEEVVNNARRLTYNGQYHNTLIAHEVLGIDLSTSESEWHKMNVFQWGFFTILFIPFIVIFVRFFINVFKQTNKLRERFKYLCVLLGSLTMLPDFLLKIDFGRWVMAVMVYYILVICASVVLRDEIIIKALDKMYVNIKAKSWRIFLLLYPIMFIPLCDTDIDGFTQQLSSWLNHLVGWYSF